MKTRIAIVGVMLCVGLLAFAAPTDAFAETTANNSGKQLDNLRQAPQGASDVGYFVGSGAAGDAKPAKAKAKPQR